MFFRAFAGALSRRRCLSRLKARAAPLARPVSPRLRALAEKTANKATGSGELHSPRAQARYQPIEPDVTSRTSAYQLWMRTFASGPGARKPRRRIASSGVATSMPPASSRSPIWSSTTAKLRANTRPRTPLPFTNSSPPRSRWSPRVLMASELCIPFTIVERDEESVPAEEAPDPDRNRARPKRAVEALIGQIGRAVDVHDDRHAR